MGEIGKRAAEQFRDNAHKRDISYEEEARRTGVCRQSFFQYETGIHEPSIKAMQKLALAGYDVNYILTGVKNNG